jgi:RNA polymerase subunit RPABC4/transcription elongation factor Spt4
MKTCPACQQAQGLNKRVCPYCGHKFISAITWVVVMVIVFVAIAGVMLIQTNGR